MRNEKVISFAVLKLVSRQQFWVAKGLFSYLISLHIGHLRTKIYIFSLEEQPNFNCEGVIKSFYLFDGANISQLYFCVYLPGGGQQRYC